MRLDRARRPSRRNPRRGPEGAARAVVRHAGTRHARVGQRSESLAAQEPEELQNLEQFAAPELRCRVVHPDPEPVLDPLGIEGQRTGHRLGEPAREHVVAFPEDQRVLDPLAELAAGDELQVHVEERIGTETDQQSGLSDVLAGKCREQGHPLGGDLATVLHDRLVVLVPDDHDEVEVGVVIEIAGEQ
jgi:hypothetical protein